jgi:amidophosphoribosyltransferase
LSDKLDRAGSIFQSTSDTEVIIHLIATSKGSSLMGRIIEALARARGAYSLLFLTLDRMIAARDPMGFRPLVLGRFQSGPSAGACVVASETCALDLIEASYWRDVEPGEIVVIGPDGVESLKPFPPAPHAKCIFEYIYFARPDSNLFGHNVYQVRKALGRQLARENGVPADLVTPVPDSGVPAAIGYAEESGIPLDFGLIRNHYVGRTFIEPTQSIRHFGVKIKLNAQRAVLEGKRVVVVDDSIVRGTTSRKIIRMLRDAGAKCTAHQLAADHWPLLLRHRHADPHRAHRRERLCGRNPPLHRGRHARLLEPRRHVHLLRRQKQGFLRRLFHRQLPGPLRRRRPHQAIAPVRCAPAAVKSRSLALYPAVRVLCE